MNFGDCCFGDHGMEVVSLFDDMVEQGVEHNDKKTKVRVIVDVKGMRKVLGSTMVEMNREIHEFVAWDKSHNQYKEIYEMVEEMRSEIKRAGHREKLAIAFALLSTPLGNPIRIVKNLHVCEDCHSTTNSYLRPTVTCRPLTMTRLGNRACITQPSTNGYKEEPRRLWARLKWPNTESRTCRYDNGLRK
ncbi:hypothetical protein VNO78_29129 [Psophocarpus tetragonolobus]|uniref:DYW domain-containing protein n=1 Tax=Psophocarpus tetragonolobus TaxID=3891 RepID=A0AAN9RUJ0_PSOTE